MARSFLCHYGYQMTVAVNVRSWRGYRFAGLDSGVMAPRCCFANLPVLLVLSLDSHCPDSEERAAEYKF